MHKQIVAETLHCVDVAADYEDKHSTGLTGRRTWVAIKLVGAPSTRSVPPNRSHSLSFWIERDGPRRRVAAQAITISG